MMDIPYPWNVVTGVACLLILLGFFGWLYVGDRRQRARFRAWAHAHGLAYTFGATLPAPSRGAPFADGFRQRHQFIGRYDEHPITVTEYRHDRPLRTATVVVAGTVDVNAPAFDVTADMIEGPPPLSIQDWEEMAERLGRSPDIHYRLENGRLMLIRRYQMIDLDQVEADAEHLAALCRQIAVPGRPPKAAPH
ncbi:hypothetical protein [Stackebrandtia soli]|uniref:hypothetical protein n=1 Tax=Stackebrandtia soli TaxID=1892856 RepID=UPI0039EC6DBD